MKILIDTNILIDYLRRTDRANALFHKQFIGGSHTPYITHITISELWAGKSMNNEEPAQKVRDLIELCVIINPHISIAKLTGKIIRDCKTRINFQVANIAATAIYENLALLTLNKIDFEKIEDIQLL